jgi:hypothetical protein
MTLINGNCQSATLTKVCVARGRGRGRKSSRKPRVASREPNQQHRPTQSTAEPGKAVLEHKPIRTEKSNEHAQHNPEQAIDKDVRLASA